jgi:hypothetical protein
MVEKKSNQEAQNGLGAEAIDQVPPVLGGFHMRNRIMHILRQGMGPFGSSYR